MPDHTPSSIGHLERMVAQAVSPQEMMKGVEQLFKATPTAQHRALALKVSNDILFESRFYNHGNSGRGHPEGFPQQRAWLILSWLLSTTV